MKNVKKRLFFVFFQSIVVLFCLNGQQIVTAERFLENVSEKYAAFNDYEARIAISSGSTDMYGTVVHKTPNFLRIDFTTPSEQVIVFNGDMLTVYLPEYRAILNQSVSSSHSSGANLATAQGLSLLRRNFAAAFLTGPDPVPLDEEAQGAREMVVKLRLTRRYGSEGFREIILSIDPVSLLIRRMQGTTIADIQVQFDFSDIKTNQGIPDRRFMYDSPPSANLYNDFLFRDTE
ncbi:MAG: outer-membrane lipoprotein carrier protein LolA [Spirochaetaceae bacterium]|nr:outer-membrane lipoprotein carrier protein LolA [Spirochaetaceae bacterium]